MKKGLVGIGLVFAILLGGTLVNWTYQWGTSMKSRADHQCTDNKDKILLQPGEALDIVKISQALEPGVQEWTPLYERVSCEDLVGKEKNTTMGK